MLLSLCSYAISLLHVSSAPTLSHYYILPDDRTLHQYHILPYAPTPSHYYILCCYAIVTYAPTVTLCPYAISLLHVSLLRISLLLLGYPMPLRHRTTVYLAALYLTAVSRCTSLCYLAALYLTAVSRCVSRCFVSHCCISLCCFISLCCSGHSSHCYAVAVCIT
eukprot:1109409-Rhodomonas_salina.3